MKPVYDLRSFEFYGPALIDDLRVNESAKERLKELCVRVFGDEDHSHYGADGVSLSYEIFEHRRAFLDALKALDAI